MMDYEPSRARLERTTSRPGQSPAAVTRRQALGFAGAALASPLVAGLAMLAGDETRPAPLRTITRGPHAHWFGYYDKLEFDPANRYVLANQVDFEHRTPRAGDSLSVGMVDTAQEDRWIELGQSRAWGWQQGCMLQWRPGSGRQVVWNDREGDHFVSHVLDVESGERRTLPRPIYAISPDGHRAVTADFARIQNMRPGYGYVGLPDPRQDVRAPGDSGVWTIDLETGQSKLILSLAQAAAIPHHGDSLGDFWHYFNHLLISPDGKRFIVLHRWRTHMHAPPEARARSGFTTRMFTVNMDGSDPHVLDPSGHTSHFVWRDPGHVCAWTRPQGRPSGFYLFEDRTRNITAVGEGVMTQNGHNTYVPGTDTEWILNDTYPDPKDRRQTLYLFHVPTRRRVVLGRFHLAPQYRGEWRCDLHPRASRDGKTVAIDSPHLGGGRQVHLVDISGIIG